MAAEYWYNVKNGKQTSIMWKLLLVDSTTEWLWLSGPRMMKHRASAARTWFSNAGVVAEAPHSPSWNVTVVVRYHSRDRKNHRFRKWNWESFTGRWRHSMMNNLIQSNVIETIYSILLQLVFFVILKFKEKRTLFCFMEYTVV